MPTAAAGERDVEAELSGAGTPTTNGALNDPMLMPM